jgi:hypothetical protein
MNGASLVCSIHLLHPHLLSLLCILSDVAHRPSLGSRFESIQTPHREAGSLINRPVTFRTIARSRHPRTGITVLLLRPSTTTELVVINLVPQHDPQPNLEFASGGHARLPHTFLDQFATVEALQLRVPAYRVRIVAGQSINFLFMCTLCMGPGTLIASEQVRPAGKPLGGN